MQTITYTVAPATVVMANWPMTFGLTDADLIVSNRAEILEFAELYAPCLIAQARAAGNLAEELRIENALSAARAELFPEIQQ